MAAQETTPRTVSLFFPFGSTSLTLLSLPYPTGVVFPDTFPGQLPTDAGLDTITTSVTVLPDGTGTFWFGLTISLMQNGGVLNIETLPPYDLPRGGWYRNTKTLSSTSISPAASSPRPTTPPATPSATPSTQTTSTSPPPSPTAQSPAPSSSPPRNTHTGAIIGGIVAGFALISVLAALFFRLYPRRKRQQEQAHQHSQTQSPDLLSPDEIAALAVAAREDKVRHLRGVKHFELSDTSPVPELDPAVGETAAWRANQLPERSDGRGDGNRDDDSDEVMRRGGGGQQQQRQEQQQQRQEQQQQRQQQGNIIETREEVSEHVQAQKRREIEWLEAEEVRLRSRRERLIGRSG